MLEYNNDNSARDDLIDTSASNECNVFVCVCVWCVRKGYGLMQWLYGYIIEG